MKATYNTPENLANKVMNAAELLAALEIPTQTDYAHRDTLVTPEAWPAFRDEIAAAGVEYMRNGDKVTIYNGPFKMAVEVTKSGVYYNRPEVDLSEVCKLAAAARPDLPDSLLAFMLNAKINITF